MVVCGALIVAMVALVVGVVWVGACGRGYDINACMAAAKARQADGQDLAVMEPAEHEGLLS